ncbi:MAG: preprotein translocase subunit SecY [Candidatus Thermoplasmatota archaeon]|nr:preprotein translocase subunit SecY [Candidatus Thermoplasmatota archaeon]
MPEEKKSLLYKFKPIIDRWPAISKPEGHVAFKTKLMWTGLILILYYMLANVMLYGVSSQQLDMFAGFRAIMAGESGSIMHLGIGPIVTGSIIMQLFVGAKIINLDLKNKDDKAIYQGFQKILVLAMIIIEAVPQVYGYLRPDTAFVGMVGDGWAKFIIIAQLFAGAYLVFMMDEVVSKWGIGSGISLFIAAGVAQAIFTGTFNWLPTNADAVLSASNPPAGCLIKTGYLLIAQPVSTLVRGGGFETLFIGSGNSLISLLGTIGIFFLVVFVEASRIELPLAHTTVRGARGRYPIKLIYASNIPVILMSTLLANINMFAILFWSNPVMRKIPLIGGKWWIGNFGPLDNLSQNPIAGGAWYVSRLNGIQEWLLAPLFPDKYGAYLTAHAPWQMAIHIVVYLGLMIFGSILFALFWIETTNMAPKDVAQQIQDSGMQIPGFRRDPRIIEKILERYIPAVTVIGAVFVGGLAAFADMIGTVGNTSGTGVLLTVGIIIQMYELIAREQAMEMHPMLRQFFGVE